MITDTPTATCPACGSDIERFYTSKQDGERLSSDYACGSHWSRFSGWTNHCHAGWSAAVALRAQNAALVAALSDMLDMFFDGWELSAAGIEHLEDGDTIIVEPGYADKIRAANETYKTITATPESETP